VGPLLALSWSSAMRRFVRRRVVALIVVLAALPLAIDAAAAATLRRLAVGDRGALELMAPDDWVTEPGRPSADPQLVLRVPGREFVMQVTARPLPVSGSVARERARKAVEELIAGREVAEAAENPQPAIQELTGSRASGYYFSMTDKTWTGAPNDYHYMTQGSMVVGSLAVGFRILSNAEGDREPALEVLRSARHAAQ